MAKCRWPSTSDHIVHDQLSMTGALQKVFNMAVTACNLVRKNARKISRTNQHFSDTQIHFDGVQHSHPVGSRLSISRLLAVHIEKDGQEILREAAHFGLFFFCSGKKKDTKHCK